MNGERSDADLTLDFVPGLLRISRVLDVEQFIIDSRERLPYIFVMPAGSKDHMPERERGGDLLGMYWSFFKFITSSKGFRSKGILHVFSVMIHFI